MIDLMMETMARTWISGIVFCHTGGKKISMNSGTNKINPTKRGMTKREIS